MSGASTSKENGQVPISPRSVASCSLHFTNSTEDRLEAGHVFNGCYQVESILAQGNRGPIYKCIHLPKGDRVVVKCLTYSPKELPEAFKVGLRLTKLKKRGLPDFIDVFCSDSKLYLVSKYINGASLETLLLERRRRPTEDECLRIAKELLGALTYLTDQKPSLVHGGIAPKTVFLQDGSYGGRAYLLGEDMRLGREIEDPKRVIYTPSRDVYDLGVTLWSLFSGCIVAPVSDAQLKLYFEKKRETSPELVSLLRRMLDNDPATRISAEEAWKMTINLSATTPNPQTPVARHPNRVLNERRMKRPRPPNARSQLLRDDSSSLKIIIPSEGLINKRIPGILLGAGSVFLSLAVLALLVAIVIEVSFLGGDLLVPQLVFLIFCVVLLALVGFGLYRFLRESFTVMEVEITNSDFIVRRVFRASKDTSNASTETEDHSSEEAQNQNKTKPEFSAKTQDMSRAKIEDAREWNGDCLILLTSGKVTHRFGKGLMKQEQEWLIDEINEFLDLIRAGV